MRYITIVLFAMLLLGCSHGVAPIAPDNIDTGTSVTPDKIAQAQSKFLWGLYNVTLDPVEGTADIVPMRGAAFKANVTQFVQPPIGKPNYVNFNNLDFSDFATQGIVRLRVAVTHPFPGLDMYRGFDVLGIFMSDASHSLQYDPGDPDAIIQAQDGSDARLLNADGYTRWFNPNEFPQENIFGFIPGIYGTPGFKPNGTVNGYKYFCDDLDPDFEVDSFFDVMVNLENRGSFTPGSVNHRDYEIQFPDPTGPLQYQYAIVASWDKHNDSGMIDLGDFALVCNQAEPFLLDPDTTESTIYYEDDTNKGGTLHIELTVYDWQAMEGEGGGIPVDEQIEEIPCESFFDVFMDPVDLLPGATVTAHGPASSTFTIDILNVNPTHAGDEWLVIGVQSADPSSYDQGFGAPASSGALTSYIITKVTVASESPFNQAPSVGDITGETEPLEIDIEEYSIAVYDPEGDPLYFEWSLVDDGLAAVWGNVGEDADTITIDWNDYGVGDYDLHCRVKDDFNDWQLAMNNPLDISVLELTITCGNGVYGYHDFAWSQNQAMECCFLSNGTVIIEHGYSFTDREFQLMVVMYEKDIGGYCYYSYDDNPCDDDWCEEYHPVYITTTDGSNYATHIDCDPNDTFGDGTETDDVVAFIQTNTPNIIRFIGSIDTAAQNLASEITATSVGTGIVIAMDFDEAGDLWVLDEYGNTYELEKSLNYILGDIKFTIDMDIVAPETTIIFDWVISYLYDDFFIFTDETTGGTIHKIDGSSGSVIVTIPNALDAGVTNPPYGLGITGARGDIEIDHRVFDGENTLAEHCRLIISGGPGGTGQAAMFARYDQALNLLSTWDNNQTGGGSCNNPPSIDGGRFIIFDPIDHVDDPSAPGDEEAWDHTMWVGDAGTGAGNLVWAASCRPAPTDWSGY